MEERFQSLCLTEPDAEPNAGPDAEPDAESDAEPDAVPFKPTRRPSLRDFELEPIPRYLFRVYAPGSNGSTDSKWVKSPDVLSNKPSANMDVFQTSSEPATAREIWGHLNWKRLDNDNLMSWTSSLLFAIQYMLFRHATDYNKPDWQDIKLCIIDTKSYSDAVFIRDMDLIDKFAPHDSNLKYFKGLRRREFYFGEYLSQGALRIEGKCEIISAEAMINAGLLKLNREFKKYVNDPTNKDWARPVLHVRKNCEDSWSQSPPISEKKIQKAIAVSQLFGQRFRLPIAINLVAVLKGEMDVEILSRVFGGFLGTCL